MEGGPYKISAYLNAEELREFNLRVLARGAGQSGYIREMLGFDIRPRGAPKGARKKKAQEKSTKPKRAQKEKASRKSLAQSRTLQLPFPD